MTSGNITPASPLCNMLDESRRGENTLSRLLELINRNDDFEFIGNEMLKIIVEGLGVERCCVFRYDENYVKPPEKLFEWPVPDDNPATRQFPSPSREHFSEHLDALLERRPVILAAEDLAAAGQPELQSRILSGIWVNERLYGFLAADCFRRVDGISESMVKILGNAAIMFALAFKQTHQHEQLLESFSQSRQIMDNLQIPILLVDNDFRVRAANPSKKVGVMLPLPKLLGTRCYDTVCKFGAPPDFCAVRETMETRKPARKEFSFGDKRLISTSQPIFDRHGEMISVLSVDIDVTEMTRQKEELKAAMEQAQAANLAKSYFLATVSHELRTPLNAVIGFSEILQSGDVDDSTREEYLGAINFAGTALLNLINDVLDLSNLEAGQTLIAPIPTDVATLVEQVAAVFKLKAQQKGIALTVEAGSLREQLCVDSQRLRQILLNLIGNAIKFTSEGGVTVKAEFMPEDETRGTLRIGVSDTGIGISGENRERIFEPFVHDSIIRGKRMYEGSGLGLTISRRLADKMGGSIKLDSTPGKGSTFTLEIKAEYEAAPGKTAAPGQSSGSGADGAAGVEKRRALLIDDVPLNLRVLKAMLSRLNVDCTTADSSETALELLRRGERYDMILTDMWMPGMNGLELAGCIRNDMRISGMPILAITADTQMSADDKAVFDGILYKPITMESLSEALRMLLPGN